MPLIPRSFDDLLLDKMVAALEAFEAEQAAIDPAVGFQVERDRELPVGMLRIPMVNMWVDSIQTDRAGSRTYSPETVRVNVDCYARGLITGEAGDIGINAATERLYYLKEQVKHGLFHLVNVDFGFPAGIIAKKAWPTWQPLKGPDNMPETLVVAGRWVLEIAYAWSPEDIEGVPLEQITVDASLWAGIYDYP